MVDLFVADPRAAVLRVLEAAGVPMAAGDVKKALLAGGVAKTDVDKKWSGVQKRLKSDPNVTVDNGRYGWTDRPAVTAIEAYELIFKGRLPTARKADLDEIVRAALNGADPGSPDRREIAARQRQVELEGLQALGELAAEIEGLIVNEVESDAVIRRIRARVKRNGLQPIDRAGDETNFDRKVHAPIGGPIRDGVTVNVVRPGYFWTDSTTDVLIAKAVVEE